jgi:hypothetical protein
VVVLGACAELWYLRAVRVVGVLAAVAPLTWIVWWAGRSDLDAVPGPLQFIAVNAYVLVAIAFVSVLWWVRGDVARTAADEPGVAVGRHARTWPDGREPAIHLP